MKIPGQFANSPEVEAGIPFALYLDRPALPDRCFIYEIDQRLYKPFKQSVTEAGTLTGKWYSEEPLTVSLANTETLYPKQLLNDDGLQLLYLSDDIRGSEREVRRFINDYGQIQGLPGRKRLDFVIARLRSDDLHLYNAEAGLNPHPVLTAAIDSPASVDPQNPHRPGVNPPAQALQEPAPR